MKALNKTFPFRLDTDLKRETALELFPRVVNDWKEKLSNISAELFSREELYNAAKNMKPGKAPDLHEITPEIMKLVTKS